MRHSFLVDNGVAQGNVPASYFFCLPLDDLLETVAPETDKAGYMDDVSLSYETHGNPSVAAMSALDDLVMLRDAYKTIGLEFNMSKVELVCAADSEITTRCADLGIKLVDTSKPDACIKILGAPVGHTEARKAWCKQRLERTQDMCSLLKDPDFHPRLAYTLLKHVHTPRAMYLAQCVHPDITGDAMATFDDITLSTFKGIFGEDIKDYWIEHPSGGNIHRMARIAPRLYERANTPRRPVEESLTDFVLRQLPIPTDLEDAAQSLSALGFYGAAWLQHSPEVNCAPQRYLSAMRIRCHAEKSNLPSWCSCGERLLSSRHLLRCPWNSGFTATHRHNDTLAELASCSRAHGIITTVEPTCYAQADNRRPDILFCLGPRSLAIDLTVVDPCGTSYVRQAAQTQGHAASVAAAEKRDKHEENVQAIGHRFAPIAVETYGHIDPTAFHTFHQVAMALPHFQRKPFVGQMLTILATGVQMGNASILDSAVRRLARGQGLLH